MSAILTVTLNPALDFSTQTARVVPGPKLRCAPPRADPGGGGVNVSRAVRILGGESRALVALGGSNGLHMESLLRAEGIDVVRVEAPGETRWSLAVSDGETGGQYRFVLPGPVWDAADMERALAAILGAISAGDYVVLSGSLPPGLPDDLPIRMQEVLAGQARLIVDTSGPAMRKLARSATGLFLLRLDGEEAEELAGHPLDSLAATARFAETLVAAGVAEVVVLARGAEGNVCADRTGAWRATAPLQKVASPVGAGDSFVGALVLGLVQGESLPEALRLGTAAAAAAVRTEATELCHAHDVIEIRAGTLMEPI